MNVNFIPTELQIVRYYVIKWRISYVSYMLNLIMSYLRAAFRPQAIVPQ